MNEYAVGKFHFGSTVLIPPGFPFQFGNGPHGRPYRSTLPKTKRAPRKRLEEPAGLIPMKFSVRSPELQISSGGKRPSNYSWPLGLRLFRRRWSGRFLLRRVA